MNQAEIRQLELSTRRKIGKRDVHPDEYTSMGSVLTFEGVAFAVPPLYPNGSTTIVPQFDGEGNVVLSVSEDDTAIDADLVAMAVELGEQIESLIVDEDICPTCGIPARSKISLDPQKNAAQLSLLFRYAGRCLQKRYDLAGEQLAALLQFSSDTLPDWVVQVLDHRAQEPATGSV